MGSGNIGATNVTRVFGWEAGFFTLVIDFFKGFLPVLLVQRLFPQYPPLEAWVAGSLVLGHCYSIFLKFRGGKGVATGLGTLSLVVPWAAALATVVYVAVILLTKVSAKGSLSGVAVALLYAVFAKISGPQRMLILLVCFVVVVRHHSNIRRMITNLLERKTRRSSI